MRIALFGGSFDPVHREHIRLAEAAREELRLDRLIFIPSCQAPHKALGAAADGEDRLAVLKEAASSLPFAEVSDFELSAGGTSYTYLTCRAFRERFPSAELFFLVGADMLEDFFGWRHPEEILKCVTLCACGRGKGPRKDLHDRFRTAFHTDFLDLSFSGEEVSSTDIRVFLAFDDDERARALLGGACFSAVDKRGLYRYAEAEQARILLTPERWAHSERVARMAVGRARGLRIPEEKAMLSAMLHDCGKYIPKSSKLLAGFRFPEGVPAPVMHQFIGAYLAETLFFVEDEDVLGAIACHTSGRPGMSVLAKLLFLSDLLEEGRDFAGIERLRRLFYEDLDLCLAEALYEQLAYLKGQNKPVYPETEAAYEWVKTQLRLRDQDPNK